MFHLLVVRVTDIVHIVPSFIITDAALSCLSIISSAVEDIARSLAALYKSQHALYDKRGVNEEGRQVAAGRPAEDVTLLRVRVLLVERAERRVRLVALAR